jgi:hypothetical protein
MEIKNENNIEEIECSRICSFNTEYLLCFTYGIGDRVLDWHVGDRPAAGGIQPGPR